MYYNIVMRQFRSRGAEVASYGKVHDSMGYAMLVPNVSQFGVDDVRVCNGSKVFFEGPAAEFADRYSDRFRWTLCSAVMEDFDGKPLVVF